MPQAIFAFANEVVNNTAAARQAEANRRKAFGQQLAEKKNKIQKTVKFNLNSFEIS